MTQIFAVHAIEPVECSTVELHTQQWVKVHQLYPHIFLCILKGAGYDL